MNLFREYFDFIISEKLFTNTIMGVFGGFTFYILSFWTNPEVYSKPKAYLLGVGLGQAIIIALLFIVYTFLSFYGEKHLKHIKKN